MVEPCGVPTVVEAVCAAVALDGELAVVPEPATAEEPFWATVLLELVEFVLPKIVDDWAPVVADAKLLGAAVTATPLPAPLATDGLPLAALLPAAAEVGVEAAMESAMPSEYVFENAAFGSARLDENERASDMPDIAPVAGFRAPGLKDMEKPN